MLSLPQIALENPFKSFSFGNPTTSTSFTATANAVGQPAFNFNTASTTSAAATTITAKTNTTSSTAPSSSTPAAASTN